MRWLSRLLGLGDRKSVQGVGPSQEDTGTLPDPKNEPVSLPVVDLDSEPRAVAFGTDALRELWIQAQPISHKDYPFLDPLYSPGSLMPCMDVSLWMAGCLVSNDWRAIEELLEIVTYRHTLTALKKTFRTYTYRGLIDGPQGLLDELRAIAILVFRIPESGHKDSRTMLHAELISQSIASQDFSLNESQLEHLQRGANLMIRRQNKEMEEAGSNFTRETVKIEELRLVRRHEATEFGRRIAHKPVTFRACLAYSLDRGSPASSLIRPQLQGHHGLRQFGLSDHINRECFSDPTLFVPTADLSALANRLKKEELLTIGANSGVDLKKSWKKDAMIGALLESEPAAAHIKQFASRDLLEIHPDMRDSFEAWRKDVNRLKDLALCLATA